MLTRKQNYHTLFLFPCQYSKEQRNLLNLFIPKSEDAHQKHEQTKIK